jgi:macrolide-specific efflux system membrane fusion protein
MPKIKPIKLVIIVVCIAIIAVLAWKFLNLNNSSLNILR